MSASTSSSASTSASTPTPYAFTKGAKEVEGATSTAGAVQLAPGATYRSSLGAGDKLYYRLTLDRTADAYVSATAVPEADATPGASAGVRVSVQDADAHRCSYDTARFGPAGRARPVTAWASREIGTDEYMCQEAGTYYVVVERIGSTTTGSTTGSTTGATTGSTSGSVGGAPDEEWALEIAYASEPAVRKGGSTSAPETWNSASPDAPLGDAVPRAGGYGFATASPVSQGVWQHKDGITPGETVYYKVPVDWGQQLYATAEIGSTTGDGDGLVGSALVLSLYNPVRGLVDDARISYDGSQRTTTLDPLPPVAYANRFSRDDEVGGMRFAGWYYLAVHLAEPVADRFGDGPFGLTLRVQVQGEPQEGPGYLGTAQPLGVFEVTEGDLEAAENGATGDTKDSADTGGAGGTEGPGSGGDSGNSSLTGDERLAMQAVAAGGIGTGSLLVLLLAIWTLVARRRAAKDPARRGATRSRGRHGPSQGW
ncbi:hypothetical protein SGFS_060090 [Streptomyces graminofaciens]|uniref:Uncharacterized protein n=1 Tax=Streptomyces graminofaciens TaxID=68212 RepID=A0ABN5VQ99_9ACTN|nr:hypothetical protein [Streptomyces graminofaciens]BBC34715.1 hypothetical protein SGFS_060090 [Streptomyces graminofaciens]